MDNQIRTILKKLVGTKPGLRIDELHQEVRRHQPILEAAMVEELWAMVDEGDLIEVAVELFDSDIAESRIYPQGSTITVLPDQKAKRRILRR